MTSPGSGFCEDPRIPKKSYTRMAWWNLAHKMWPGHGVISCTLQDLRRSSQSSFADVLPVKPWIQSRLKAAAFKFEYLHLCTQPKHGS